MLGNGKGVGQLLGGCGEGGDCDPNVNQVDGAIFKTWDKVKQYLDPTKYTLTVSKTGNGSGTVTSNPSGINCGNTCSSKYADGTEVQLTATAASGSTCPFTMVPSAESRSTTHNPAGVHTTLQWAVETDGCGR